MAGWVLTLSLLHGRLVQPSSNWCSTVSDHSKLLNLLLSTTSAGNLFANSFFLFFFFSVIPFHFISLSLFYNNIFIFSLFLTHFFPLFFLSLPLPLSLPLSLTVIFLSFSLSDRFLWGATVWCSERVTVYLISSFLFKNKMWILKWFLEYEFNDQLNLKLKCRVYWLIFSFFLFQQLLPFLSAFLQKKMSRLKKSCRI